MTLSRFLITGGSQGIGAAVVELARAAGHQVVFTGRNQELIDALAQQDRRARPPRRCLEARDNARTVDFCAERMGGIDVLVNNAGYAYRGEIGALDVAKMKEMFDTNVFGLVDLTNLVVPQMKEARPGRHRQHRVHVRHEGRGHGDSVRRQQVGPARHQPVLAGRAAAAWDPRHLRVPVGSADELRRASRAQQSEQALRGGHRRDDHGRAQHAAAGPVAGAGRVRHQSVEGRLTLLFALTTSLSAFLLFSVQPLIAKQIVPWFGGTSAVWTLCLVFFQSLLTAGYAYGDWTTRRLGARSQAALHLGLLALSLISLPIVVGDRWKPAGGEEPSWRILGLLGATIGLPYFLLSTTSPLVQTWFARRFPRRRRTACSRSPTSRRSWRWSAIRSRSSRSCGRASRPMSGPRDTSRSWGCALLRCS